MVHIDFYDKTGCAACKIMKDIIKSIINDCPHSLTIHSLLSRDGAIPPVEDGTDKPQYPTIVIRSDNIPPDVIFGTCTKHFIGAIINKHIANDNRGKV